MKPAHHEGNTYGTIALLTVAVVQQVGSVGTIPFTKSSFNAPWRADGAARENTGWTSYKNGHIETTNPATHSRGQTTLARTV
ncbi:hypothetical protein LSAT2_031110 [Lamellibrachia satsuma]|nr:hypothetical protein LSAT2_031110 [Lamellibrachia satsuma]